MSRHPSTLPTCFTPHLSHSSKCISTWFIQEYDPCHMSGSIELPFTTSMVLREMITWTIRGCQKQILWLISSSRRTGSIRHPPDANQGINPIFPRWSKSTKAWYPRQGDFGRNHGPGRGPFPWCFRPRIKPSFSWESCQHGLAIGL